MRVLRSPLRRGSWRSRAYWTIAIATAVATGTIAAGVVDEGERRAAAWGPSRPVAVASHDLAAGATVQAGDVTVEVRPVGGLPDGTVAGGTELGGRVVVDRIVAGEPIVASRLAPSGMQGAAALVPAGDAAVLVPATTHPPRLAVGNHVDLVGGVRAGVDESGRGGGVLARDATVVDVPDDGSVLVAVPREQAAAVASAVLDGSIVIALVGG